MNRNLYLRKIWLKVKIAFKYFDSQAINAFKLATLYELDPEMLSVQMVYFDAACFNFIIPFLGKLNGVHLEGGDVGKGYLPYT